MASWISTAGWAAAARRVLGAAWVVTPEGILDPDATRARGSSSTLGTRGRPVSRVPVGAKTAVKDVRQWWRARRFRVPVEGPWREHDVRFVWQRHELFQDAGIELARAVGAPSVVFVPAPLVWEATQWGVRRTGWGRPLEHWGEARVLRQADLVCAGSDSVADELARLGVAAERMIVTPTGVDLDVFDRPVDRGALRARLGIEGRFVVGWVGSFRRFHGLEQLVDAVARLGDATLLLVGDGPEKFEVEHEARRRGVHAVFVGTVPNAELPDYLAAMDVGVVLGRADQPFHYSPLKLAEYMAAGLPVIAPAVPQIQARVRDGVDALLVDLGDAPRLLDTLERLQDSADLRATLATNARQAARATWSWDEVVKRVDVALVALRA